MRQRLLDLGGERLAAMWKQLPERCRKEVIALWAQLIAGAAQSRSKRKGAKS